MTAGTMKVRVTKANDNNWYKVGEEHVVLVEPRGSIEGSYHPIVEGGRDLTYGVGADDFKIVSEKKPHKHAEAIKAWADGEVIQYSACGKYWANDSNPAWIEHYQYRVKPKAAFPKTNLTGQFMSDFWDDTDDLPNEAYCRLANYILKEFITSGQMDAYIKERDNANN